MTDVILYGPPQSTYTRTARMIAIEKVLTHELAPIDFKGPTHFAKHPWGRVPILKHGDVDLIETAAIARYLDAIGPGPELVPAEPLRAARMEKWISVVNCYAYPDLVLGYLFHYLFPKSADKQPDRALIAKGLPNVEKDLREIEKGFEGEWLTGSSITLADLFVAPIVWYVSRLPEAAAVLETCPHLQRFLGAVAQRKSFRETVPPPLPV